jgi:hypothetical protein
VTARQPNLVPLNRSLDQELAALLRGASLECPVCGEFLLHVQGALAWIASKIVTSR